MSSMPELARHKVDQNMPLDHRVWLNTADKSRLNGPVQQRTITRADIEGPSISPNMSPRTVALERRLQALQMEQSFWKSLLHAQKRLANIQTDIQSLEGERKNWEKTIHEQERLLLYKILAESKADSPIEDLGIDQTSRNQYLFERLPSIVERLKQQSGADDKQHETEQLTKRRHDSSKSTHSQGSYGSTRRRSSIVRRVSITGTTDKQYEFGKVPSGKSLQSQSSIRTRLTSISRSEYHEDLKEDLKAGYTHPLGFTAFIIVFGSSFLFGYNIGVLNQVKDPIKYFYNQTYEERSGTPVSEGYLTFLWSLTTAIFIPGGMLGSFLGGWLADKLGRKKSILLSHVFVFVGAVLATACQAATAPELIMIGRFLFGVNNGIGNCIAPLYLSEIAPYNMRGAFGTLHQLSITFGIFLSSVFGLRQLLGTNEKWVYLMLIEAGPALISLIVLPFLPESPRFLLLSRGDRDGAERSLQFYRRRDDVSADMEEMDTEAHLDKGDQSKGMTLKEFFMARDLRMPIFIMCMLQVIQQFSGINAIFFYSDGIFENARVSKDQRPLAVIGTNAVNVAMTVVSVPLIEKAGRRPLLLFPMIAMIFDLALITVALNLESEDLVWMAYISVACVIIYVICFAVGLGPIPMMVGSELFRQEPRAIAMAVGGAVNWTFTFIIALGFESVQEAAGNYTFVIFLILMIGFTVFVYFQVPETKGKTIEEIAGKFAPSGDKIEVEEAVDDVFEDAIPEADEDEDAEHVTLNFGDKKKEDGDVAEKVPLTKIENDIKS